MPRYRNLLSERRLDYGDSGGPVVEPGAEFEHDIPPAQLASHLRSGFICEVAAPAAARTDERAPSPPAFDRVYPPRGRRASSGDE